MAWPLISLGQQKVYFYWFRAYFYMWLDCNGVRGYFALDERQIAYELGAGQVVRAVGNKENEFQLYLSPVLN
jgi:hypothetical protein